MCLLYYAFSVLAIFGGLLLFLMYGKEKDVYKSINELSWIQLILKVIKKFCSNYKQGVIKIDSSLVYVADAANPEFPFSLSPRNHKITVKGIKFTDEDVTKYKSLCGYQPSDSVPICYAEILFMKPLIALITSTKFCLCPFGLIHIRQTIKQSVSLTEYVGIELTATAAVKKYRQNDRGVEVDIELRLLDNRDICVWEGTTTLFSRKTAKPKQQVKPKADTYTFCDNVNVPGNCGVNYAKLSGDWNPHHLYWWTAIFLGFKKPIAHGMWTLSKALSILQRKNDSQLDGKHEIRCEFKRPLLMPGKISVKYNDPDDALYNECKLRVEDTNTGVPHLLATVKTL